MNMNESVSEKRGQSPMFPRIFLRKFFATLFVMAAILLSQQTAQAAISYIASASNPADNGSSNTSPRDVTPPGGMVTGDLVILVANVTTAGATLAISATGGQAWTSQPDNTTNTTQRIFWARFNGTWSANPSVSFSDTTNTTVVMHVFRPTSGTNTWAIDVAQTNASFAAPGGARDVTITGITTVTNGALVFATWATTDDNSWGLQTAGWSNAGQSQYRNRQSNDSSQSSAYKIMPVAGASGDVVNRQTANAPDAGNSSILAFREVTPPPYPVVVSINRASFNPTTNNTVVSWTVTFDRSVTGVDATDFSLVQAGGAAGATITGVTGSGTTWTVNANTGTGSSGTVQLKLVDNDSIVSGATPLGGAGAGNGNFSGQSYTILASVCTGAADIIFCDDFERSNPGTVGNGWTVTPANPANCTGTAGNTGCAGIDSDIPPFDVYANPRANPTRAMFTRWNIVTVTSPVINMAGKAGGQFSFWIRRGHDDFSECPEAAGENYLVEYYASDGTWKTLAQFPSSPSAALCDGAIFTPTIELPADALHANFQLRFYQPSGSGQTGSGGAPGVVGYDYWHMDDVVIREKPAPSFVGAFCDNFEGGLGRWSISAEGAPAGAVIGDAGLGTLVNQSPTHALAMRWGYVAASTFKTDITGVTGNITYWVRSGTTTADANMDPDAGEDLIVEYLNSSGTWTNLATYLGSDAAGTTYNASIPIPANAKHANFRLRFRHLNASGYDLDYWHVDDVCVGDLVPTADLAITKVRNGAIVPGTNASYAINVTNNGPGTLSGSVQVTDPLPAALSYLSGTGTGWVCSAVGQNVTCNWSGTLVPAAAAPTLTLTVAVSPGAMGTVANTATVTGTAVDNVPGNNSSTDTATIYIPSYVFTDKACQTGVAIGAGANPCNLVNWSPQTAGQSLGSIYITALNASGIPTQLSGSTSTVVNFQFALSCVNPTANAGVQATFSAVGGVLPLCAANGAVPGTWSSSVALSFPATVPSVGPYTFNYNDVGKVDLYVRNASAPAQIGDSGEFVVKPAGFVLSAIKCTTADAANCAPGALPSGNNPAAANAAGASFIQAGKPFSVTVTAVTAGGVATPNYGKETTPESVKLTATTAIPGMVYPTPNTVGGTFGGFAAGVSTGTAFTWNEVGIITLTPSIGDGDYLGAGDVTGALSVNVGRFIPAFFEVTKIDGCGGAFTYSRQAFGRVTVTAKAVGNTVTKNYVNGLGLAKSVDLSDGNGSAAGAFGNGNFAAAGFVANGTQFKTNVTYGFSNQETAPLTLKLRAIETSPGGDGVTSAAGTYEDSAEIRSGRLHLINAYGSELVTLLMPVRVEYYTADGWVTNTADTCTTIGLANLSLTNNVHTPPPGPGVATITVNAGPPIKTTTVTPIALSSGAGSLSFSAPMATGYADSTMSLSGATWLRYDWDGDSTLDDPVGRATFGLFRGSPRNIYLQERY